MKTKYYLTSYSMTSQPVSLKNISLWEENNTGIFKLKRGSLNAYCMSESAVFSSKMTNCMLCRTNCSLMVPELSTV